MDEERAEHRNPSTDSDRVLHIFPTPSGYVRIVKEHNIPHDILKSLRRRRRFRKLKRRIKRFSKKYKIQFLCRRRRFPHSTREHTDFDRYSYKMTCPNCLSYIKTDIYYYNTGVTHTIAASLSPLCMCMVPYLIKRFKNIAHYCPRCKIYLGTKFGAGRDVFFCFVEQNDNNTDI